MAAIVRTDPNMLRRRASLIVVSTALLLTPSLCLATPYGRNGYSGCHYNEGCTTATQTTKQPSLQQQAVQTLTNGWSTTMTEISSLARNTATSAQTTIQNPARRRNLLGALIFIMALGFVAVIARRRKDKPEDDAK